MASEFPGEKSRVSSVASGSPASVKIRIVFLSCYLNSTVTNNCLSFFAINNILRIFLIVSVKILILALKAAKQIPIFLVHLRVVSRAGLFVLGSGLRLTKFQAQ